MVKRFKIDIAEAATPAKPKVHPMGIHVSHVNTPDGPRYKVHAVGHHLADGIKVGEHLSDSELDDATEMGAKIKHVKEEAELDISEGKYDPAKDTFSPETHTAVTKDGKDKIIRKGQLAQHKAAGWKERHSLRAFHANREKAFNAKRPKQSKLPEEVEQTDEAMSHQAATTMKHIKNPTAGEKQAAKDIKPGVAGYRDRIAMLKSAEARGALKKEEVEQTSVEADFNIVTQLKKSIDAADMKGGADIRFADGTSAFVPSDVALRVAESLLILKPAARQHIQETIQSSYKHLMAVHGMIK